MFYVVFIWHFTGFPLRVLRERRARRLCHHGCPALSTCGIGTFRDYQTAKFPTFQDYRKADFGTFQDYWLARRLFCSISGGFFDWIEAAFLLTILSSNVKPESKTAPNPKVAQVRSGLNDGTHRRSKNRTKPLRTMRSAPLALLTDSLLCPRIRQPDIKKHRPIA